MTRSLFPFLRSFPSAAATKPAPGRALTRAVESSADRAGRPTQEKGPLPSTLRLYRLVLIPSPYARTGRCALSSRTDQDPVALSAKSTFRAFPMCSFLSVPKRDRVFELKPYVEAKYGISTRQDTGTK